jgi:hypothetical protein
MSKERVGSWVKERGRGSGGYARIGAWRGYGRVGQPGDDDTRYTGQSNSGKLTVEQDKEEGPPPTRSDARSTHRLASPVTSTPDGTGNSYTSESTSSHLINRTSELELLSTRPPVPRRRRKRLGSDTSRLTLTSSSGSGLAWIGENNAQSSLAGAVCAGGRHQYGSCRTRDVGRIRVRRLTRDGKTRRFQPHSLQLRAGQDHKVTNLPQEVEFERHVRLTRLNHSLRRYLSRSIPSRSGTQRDSTPRS